MWPLDVQFEKLHEMSYSSEWYNCPQELRKSLNIIQAVTSQPVYISASIFHFNFKFYETVGTFLRWVWQVWLNYEW